MNYPDGLNCLTLSDYVSKKSLRQRNRQAIYEAFNNCCAYCGGKAESLDHIIPKDKGGSEAPWNLAASCLSCNGLKSNKDVWDFFEAQPFYCQLRAEFLVRWMTLQKTPLLPLSVQELGPEFDNLYMNLKY